MSDNERWGEGRDEYPIRDMRYGCPRCLIVRSFGYKELCTPCQKEVDDVERIAQAMADYANRDRYVLENGSQSTGVEPYENDADDFRDLAEVAVKAMRNA